MSLSLGVEESLESRCILDVETLPNLEIELVLSLE